MSPKEKFMQSSSHSAFRAAIRQWACPSCSAWARAQSRRVHVAPAPRTTRLDFEELTFSRPERSGELFNAQAGEVSETHARFRQYESRRPASTPFTAFLSAHSKQSTVRKPDGRGDHGFGIALRRKDPEAIISALTDAAEDAAFLQKIPPATWTEVLRLLNPMHWMPKLHRIHRSMNATQLRQLGFDHSQKQRRWNGVVDTFMSACMTTGGDIAHYRLLLSYAAALGDRRLASKLWGQMMRVGVKADLLCYNSYMEAIVWDEGARLRQAGRARETMPPTPAKATPIQLWQDGISDETEAIFQDMKKAGVNPTTTSYCSLMTALSRDGDLKAVEAILKSVWNIDLDVSRAHSIGPDMTAPASISKTSPIYPDSKLLITVAEIFGTHNDIPKALAAVDTLSRQYGIAVKENAWYRLLQWTWLYARRPSLTKTTGGERRGRLRQRTVSQLYATMISTGMTSSATIEKFHLLFRNKVGPLRRDIRVSPLDEGRQLYVNSVIRYRMLRQKYLDSLQVKPGERQLFTRRRLKARLHAAELRKRRDRQYLSRWVSIALKQYMSSDWKLNAKNAARVEDWRVRKIPNLLLKWRSFVSSNVRYLLDGGVVELRFRTEEEIVAARARKPTADQRRRFLYRDKHEMCTFGSGLRSEFTIW